MYTCASCGVQHTEGTACNACKQHFDFPCSGVTEAGYRKLGDRKNAWKCPRCKSGQSGSVSPQPSQLDRMQEQLSKITLQLAPLATLVEDIKAIKHEVSGLKDSVELAHERITSSSDKVSTLELKVSEMHNLAEDIPVLHAEIDRLNRELQDRDQWARMKNVEIRGVPLRNSENLYDVVGKIALLSKFSMRKEDINYIARVPTRAPGSDKPIVVALNNRYLKEEFVALARKSNELCLLNLGFSTAGKIYVNDHLTLFNKELLRKARSLAKEKNFQFVWVKHCKIMARRSETSHIIHIKNEKDLS
ncbi:uncharacterized protein LOC106139904, partial [Amyelois transitella]|uniref:uncharacterized protein LOC106139904 n=1 Tax=Amyelois transitella TaxID=680683 RepID=UPI00298F4226